MASTNTNPRTYKLGSVKPWVQSAANLLGNMFGFTNIGGYREHGSVPNSDHPKGLALDFMTLDPKKAHALIDYVLANLDALGVSYVIYNRQIWTPEKGWHPYTGPSPHTDHVHVSFKATPGTGTPITPQGVTAVSNPLGWDKWPIVGQLNTIAKNLQDADHWKRFGGFLLGGTLVIGGAWMLMRDELAGPVTQAAGTIRKVT